MPERSLKGRVVQAVQVHALNRPVRAALQLGLPVPGVALLETTGRVSGQRRRTPVSDGLDPATGTFWIVAEHGRAAAYVRNLEAQPRVRVRARGRWRDGVARVLDADDPRARQREMRGMRQLTALAVRAFGTDLLTIRIDLDA